MEASFPLKLGGSGTVTLVTTTTSEENEPGHGSTVPSAIGTIPNKDRTADQILEILKEQDRRRVSPFEANKLERDAQRNWDIFYKNNTTNFFKDRHWTLREFQEILTCHGGTPSHECSGTILLEVGCGVGNLVFPILKEVPSLYIYACDFSPRAVDFVRSNPEYSESRIKAFTSDVTQDNCFSAEGGLLEQKADFVSLIFVISAISPEKHESVVRNLTSVTKPGGIVCFRDYGRYDMAQLRFKGGKKIDENFYARRDGTRSYYFTPEEIESLFTANGQFKKLQCEYVHRRTINVKEEVDTERIFVQAKFLKM